MIKSWRLARFKSVQDETLLEFAPLTIFAGANSSGKSTIIQSMLLTAQTLQSPVYARPVILNGHMARLGAFTDIVSNAREEDTILVGFELTEAGDLDAGGQGTFLQRPLRGMARRVVDAIPSLIQCHFKFSIASSSAERELLRLQPLLEESGLKAKIVVDEEIVEDEILVRRSKSGLAERINYYKLDPDRLTRPELNALEYEVVRSPRLGRRQREFLGIHQEASKDAGVVLQHFLPTRLSVVYDAVEAEVRQLLELVIAPSHYPLRDPEFMRFSSIAPAIGELLAAELESTLSAVPQEHYRRLSFDKVTKLRTEGTVRSFYEVFRSLAPSVRASFTQRMSDKASELKRLARGGRPPKFEMRFAPMPDPLDDAVASVQQFFGGFVKYLGPLRDEPKPVYPLAGATDPRDVGFRGEHTAAVLDIHRKTEIRYVPSNAYSTTAVEQPVVTAPLLDAVLDWVAYMGVGSDLRTLDQGKLGHELKIATPDAPLYHDLTQVGVGVSQVLPILVLSLLASPGSTLIFEQPELHLHPRVQTRLADFFVSLTRVKKQCVVETHSEYMINRLRYQAAVSEGRHIADSVIMYFVEKAGGRSTYRKIRVNEFGVIEDWPKGFFDENEANAAAILRAGLDKRRRQVSRNDD